MEEHSSLESTYGSSSILSTSFPDESECLVVKKKTDEKLGQSYTF